MNELFKKVVAGLIYLISGCGIAAWMLGIDDEGGSAIVLVILWIACFPFVLLMGASIEVIGAFLFARNDRFE